MENLLQHGYTDEVIKVPERKGSSVLVAKDQLQAIAEMQKRAKDLASAARNKIKEKEEAENEKLMKDLDNFAEDEDLLNGLDQLQKKEEEELNQVRRPSGNVGIEQGQGKESSLNVTPDSNEKKKDQPEDSSFGKYLVIAGALAVAAGVIVYKNMQKK